MLIDHKNPGFNPDELSIKESFLKAHIVKIKSSFSHFLALKKKIRPGVSEWEPKQVQLWIGKVGFDYCQKIILYTRISGA